MNCFHFCENVYVQTALLKCLSSPTVLAIQGDTLMTLEHGWPRWSRTESCVSWQGEVEPTTRNQAQAQP